MILVVGATGQLGTAVVRQLEQAGRPVRVLVRHGSDFGRLFGERVDLAFGDLRDRESLESACDGVEAVVATANTAIPRAPYSFEAIEGQGYANLLSTAARRGVEQFLLVSVPATELDDKVPTSRYKRLTERRVAESGMPFTIFRAAPFMDDWIALLGSTIPFASSEAATLSRPFWFSRVFMRAVGNLIEKRGIALVPGTGKARHAFVAADDVASFLVSAIGHSRAQDATYELGGPEILSWDEAVAIFARVLRRPVRPLHVPAAAYRLLQLALQRVSPAASNLMALSWWLASIDTSYDMTETARIFEVRLTSLEEFLRTRVEIPLLPR